MYAILSFLVATLRKQEEIGELSFTNLFYLTEYTQILSFQHVIGTKNYRDILQPFLFSSASLRNPVGILHLCQFDQHCFKCSSHTGPAAATRAGRFWAQGHLLTK